MEPLRFILYGQAASKANSRRLLPGSEERAPRIIKSKAALTFMRDARRQIPPAARVRLQGPVAVRLLMMYGTERPDLDESVVLDALQDFYVYTKLGGQVRRDLVQPGVYCNDRQVRWKLVIHGIDRKAPRVEVQVVSIAAIEDLFASDAAEAPLPF